MERNDLYVYMAVLGFTLKINIRLVKKKSDRKLKTASSRNWIPLMPDVCREFVGGAVTRFYVLGGCVSYQLFLREWDVYCNFRCLN